MEMAKAPKFPGWVAAIFICSRLTVWMLPQNAEV